MLHKCNVTTAWAALHTAPDRPAKVGLLLELSMRNITDFANRSLNNIFIHYFRYNNLLKNDNFISLIVVNCCTELKCIMDIYIETLHSMKLQF